MSADPAAAIQHLESASRILEEVGAQNEVARVLLALGEFHRITGDPRTARTLLEGALRRFEEIGTLDEPPRVRAALAALGATPTA
jgi:hypothetical protein